MPIPFTKIIASAHEKWHILTGLWFIHDGCILITSAFDAYIACICNSGYLHMLGVEFCIGRMSYNTPWYSPGRRRAKYQFSSRSFVYMLLSTLYLCNGCVFLDSGIDRSASYSHLSINTTSASRLLRIMVHRRPRRYIYQRLNRLVQILVPHDHRLWTDWYR